MAAASMIRESVTVMSRQKGRTRLGPAFLLIRVEA